jgi:hypothetical protein
MGQEFLPPQALPLPWKGMALPPLSGGSWRDARIVKQLQDFVEPMIFYHALPPLSPLTALSGLLQAPGCPRTFLTQAAFRAAKGNGVPMASRD